MKGVGNLIGAVLLLFMSLQAQEGSVRVTEITDEPHHTLLFQNDEVRVFHLKLQPNDVTLPHRHSTFYAYLSLHPVTIGNEVRGRQPVLTQLEGGELHTSKGGFTVAERNNSSEPADVLVIEAMKAEDGSFATPMDSFRFHDAAFGELFVAPMMRGYTLTIAAGGRTEQHKENYDRLLVAITDLKLRETKAEGTQSDLEMRAGDIRWLPRGVTHSVTNIGASSATFITLEFT